MNNNYGVSVCLDEGNFQLFDPSFLHFLISYGPWSSCGPPSNTDLSYTI